MFEELMTENLPNVMKTSNTQRYTLRHIMVEPWTTWVWTAWSPFVCNFSIHSTAQHDPYLNHGYGTIDTKGWL